MHLDEHLKSRTITEYLKLINSCTDDRLCEYGIHPSNWSLVTSAEHKELIQLISSWENWTLDTHHIEPYAHHRTLPIMFQIIDGNLLYHPFNSHILSFVDPSFLSILKSSFRFHGTENVRDISQSRSIVIAVTEIYEKFKTEHISFHLPESVPYQGDYTKLVSYIADQNL